MPFIFSVMDVCLVLPIMYTEYFVAISITSLTCKLDTKCYIVLRLTFVSNAAGF